MRLHSALCAFLSLLLLPGGATANPVSFKDGWGIMPSYGGDWSDLQFNYSYTNRDALGVSGYYRDGDEHTATFGIVQYNYLVKRWNEMDSQASIYLSVGAGGRRTSDESGGFAGYAGMEADYETRRVYALVAVDDLQSAGDVDFARVRTRLGIAPYKAPIDKLQTWLMLQFEYMPEMEDEAVMTPLVRFFYNNYALELGASLDGEPFVGAMAHF